MSESCECAVPLIEKLRCPAIDRPLQYSDDHSWTTIPVHVLCKEAADRIEELEAQLESVAEWQFGDEEDPMEDTRPPKDGFAPGTDTRLCLQCRREFMGALGSRQCADCAYGDKRKGLEDG